MTPDFIRSDNGRDLGQVMSVLSRLLTILDVALMSVALSGVLPAAVIIGNLSGNSPSVHSFDSASTMSLGGTIGASNVTLTSANLRLQAQDLSGEAGLLIYSDDSGDPGTTLLADLGTQTVSGVSFSDYFFAPATQPLLLANSKYWLTITTTITSTSTITSLLHPNALLVAADSTLSPPSGSFATFLGLRFDDGNSITNLDSSQIPFFSGQRRCGERRCFRARTLAVHHSGRGSNVSDSNVDAIRILVRYKIRGMNSR
jgi:hypothetical protein